MLKNLLLSTVLVGMTVSTAAFAAEKSPWQVRGRIIDVIPQEDSTVNVGGEVKVGDRVAPEVDVTYYFTPNISAELIAATTKHSLKHSAAGALGDTWVLPPTITAQYHFTPDSAFSPYVGAGLNYSMFYNEKGAAGVNDLKLDGGVGYALQAGFDYWLNDNWGVNVDVKKLFLNVDAKLDLSGTPVTADVDLDPVIIGTGVSYRF